jgi:hypothetical protein
MSKLRAHHINEAVVLLAVCAGSTMLGLVLGGPRGAAPRINQPQVVEQSDEKVIVTAEHPDDPWKFGNVLRVNNVKIAMGGKFSARSIAESSGGSVEDWLENLQFSLENKSDRPITYIHLELQFPDTTINGPLMVYDRLSIGIPPGAVGDTSRYGEPLALVPGDAFMFTLSARDLRAIKDFLALRKFQLTDINKAVVQVLYVIFDDGIKWTLGGSYIDRIPVRWVVTSGSNNNPVEC